MGEARRDMATGRDEHGCSQVSFDGGATVEVMVAGGPNSRESEIYNPASDSWRPAASFDHTAFGPGMAVLDGKPTVIGGTKRMQRQGTRIGWFSTTWRRTFGVSFHRNWRQEGTPFSPYLCQGNCFARRRRELSWVQSRTCL